jgi:hypothetical protein
LRWGTSNFQGYSQYEEEDLIGSKMKKSSRREERKRPWLVIVKTPPPKNGSWRIQNASEYLEEELVRLVGCMV